MNTASGFFRFNMAFSHDQITVRIKSVQALGEVSSLGEKSSIRIWLSGGSEISIGYGSKSAAERDRGDLMQALLWDSNPPKHRPDAEHLKANPIVIKEDGKVHPNMGAH